jgi:hypothetical protein
MMRAAVLSAALWAAGAGAGLAQQFGQGAEVGPSWWRILGALVLCLALALGAALALRARMGVTGPPRFRVGAAWFGGLASLAPAGRRLRRIEAIRVSHSVEVCLFACGDRQYLIAATANAVVLLKEEPAPPQETAG